MKKLLKYIFFGFIGIIGIIIIGMILGGSDKNKGSESITATETSIPQEVQKVQILPFIKEFDENQLAAEEKYKGKYIEFTGYIKNISEDIMGSPFLSVNPNTDPYYLGTNIQCFFKNKSELTSLKNTQTITLQGRVESQSLGIIIIKDCKVVIQ